MKKRIGITGQHGFIGSYLYNRVGLLKDEFITVPFERSFFEDDDRLSQWVKECDVIVHLAAMNRHGDPKVIFDTNVSLVEKLLAAIKKSGNKPHLLFSSSTQEQRDNLYGNSKKQGRQLLAHWAQSENSVLTGLIVPNVFGPFGKPMYNSVIATFSHQLCNDQVPVIDVDGTLNLIYVDELASVIIDAIRNEVNDAEHYVQHTAEIKVSEILSRLQEFKSLYLGQGIFPQLPDPFTRNLFNTFRSYIDYSKHFPVKLKKNTDDRGSFVETVKLRDGGQVSFSTTRPGITRGNHFHTRKIERFAVISGKASIQLRKYNTSEVLEFHLDGNEPSYVDMPIWYTHNITNTGSEDLYTIFWINEFFDAADADTYFETV